MVSSGAYFRICQKENSSLEGIRSNNPLLRARRLLQASEIAGLRSQPLEKEKTMPLTAESIVAPGGRPIRKLMFGLAAWKFWRSNPSTTEMLSAGQVFLREDMRNFNPKYVEAWLFEFDIKMQRKQAAGKTVDDSLARLKDQICNVMEEKNSREASSGSPDTLNLVASAPQ
jgi:hypothetical protein